MILKRQELENREVKWLSPLAIKSKESRGRNYVEAEDDFRTCFQRDRDRIIHSKAFRRLKGKTQVFFANFGDHYRSRLTHTMEVAQLSRDMARCLNLNEDLAETIALAHDLGHTPFGHSGQDAMDEIMKSLGSYFEHNEQSRRVIEVLETKYAQYPGLNLTFEVRDGLIKHRTFYDQPIIDNDLQCSLEGQMVNIADEIAYLNHDIEDGLRAKILHLEALKKLDIWKIAEKRLKIKSSDPFYASRIKSAITRLMTEDLIKNTAFIIEKKEIKTIDQIYHHKESLSKTSKEMTEMSKELKAYLHENFYRSKKIINYNKRGQEVITALFEHFQKNFNTVPDEYRLRFQFEEKSIIIKDYIAGMTDQFALEIYENLRG